MLDKLLYILTKCIAAIKEGRLMIGEKLQALPQMASQRGRFTSRAALTAGLVGFVGLTILVVLLGLRLGGESTSAVKSLPAGAESATVEVVQGLVEYLTMRVFDTRIAVTSERPTPDHILFRTCP